jgi:hypothetical protein
MGHNFIFKLKLFDENKVLNFIKLGEIFVLER